MNLEKEVFELSVEDIMPNRFQPREKFDEHALNELALSIKEHGVIQPIIVRKIGDKYEIVAGERRFRASKIAGKKTIPALIRNIEDKESAKIALLENLQRKNLTAIEEARTYQTILKLDNLTQEELANNLGKSQSTVANKLRLLNLDIDVQNALLEEKISERHARSLLNLEDKSKQKEYLNKVILNRMTVKQLDEEISTITGKKAEEPIEDSEGETAPLGGIISNFVDSPEIVNAMTDEIIPSTQPILPETNVEVPAIPTQMENVIPQQEQIVSSAQPREPLLTIQPTTPVVETPIVIPEPIQPVVPTEIPTIETPAPQTEEAEPALQVPNFFNTRLSKEKEENQIISNTNQSAIAEKNIEEPQTQNIMDVPSLTPAEEETYNNENLSIFDSIDKLLNNNKPKEEEQKKEIEEQQLLDSLNNNLEIQPNIEEPVDTTPKYSFEEPIIPIPQQNNLDEIPKEEHVYSFEQKEPVIEINSTQKTEEPQTQNSTISSILSEPIIQTPVVEATKDDIYDLRFAINNFRQAVQNTEKFGFNIETEEFDFNNVYQIVIKIDKNK